MINIEKEAVLVTPEDVKSTSKYFKVLGTFNPGAIRMPNGEIVLYVRVAEKVKKEEDAKHYFSPRCAGKKKCDVTIDKFLKKDMESKSEMDFVFKDGTKRLTYISHFRRVVLDRTGFNVKSIEKNPSFQGLTNDGEYGIEDARITKFGDEYLMTYVALSNVSNVSTNLAVSKDCLNWERRGIIFRMQNKDVVIFPEKVNDKYVAFNRPEGNFQFSPPKIWISFSEDLKLWGNSRPVVLSAKGHWDYARVGAGAPPLRTEKGWLLIYHGVTEHHKKPKGLEEFMKKIIGKSGEIYHTTYSIGAALFDLKDPGKLIAKTPHPIIFPMKKYEKEGFVNNVIFTTGLVKDENGKDLLLFSGGADTVVTVKKISFSDVTDSLVKV